MHVSVVRPLTILALGLYASASAAAPSPAELWPEIRKAAGGAAWDKAAVLVQVGTTVDSGMSGAWRSTIDLAGGNLVISADFGHVRSAEGISGDAHWRQDFSGGVHRLDSSFAVQATATDLWLAARGYLRPGYGGAALGAVEERTVDGRRYFVLTATPAGGRPVELWFDADSHLLARTVRPQSISTDTTTYGDYRLQAGRELPFAVSVTSTGGDHSETTITHASFVPSVDPSTFAEPPPPADWTLAGDSTTVPIEFDGAVTVEAMINDRGPYAFILDTGGHDILTAAAASELGLKTFGNTVSGGAGAGTVAQKYARVDRVQLGEAVLTNQPFAVIAMPWVVVDRGLRPPFAGILGLELFERFAARLDYAGRKLTLTPLAKYRHTGGGRRVPLRFTDDMPLVPAKLDGIDGEFAIDTGNAGTLVVQHVWAERHGLAAAMKRGLAMVSFGMGGESRVWASRAESFELGGVTLPHVVVRYAEDKAGSFSSISEAGNVGNTVLPYFTVEFDYAAEAMWLEPVKGFEPPPFSRAGVGLYKTSRDTCLVIALVPDGPAARAGLRTGDRVIKIGDTPVATLSMAGLRDRFSGAPGTAVPVTVSRDGAERVCTVVLRDLLP